MEPQQEEFHIFGDESQFCGAVVYGLVIVSSKARAHVENEIARIKREFGLQATDRIHCREIFNEAAKRKTPLKHLAKDKIFDLLKALLVCCYNSNARMWVGHVNSTNAPHILLFEGKDKTKVDKWDIRDVNVKMVFAYYAAMGPVLHILTHEKCKAWVDGDTSKVSDLMGSKQVNTFKRFFPIDHKDERFIPTPVKESKPSLIEIADILAYVPAHHLSATHTKDKMLYDAMLNRAIGYSEVVFDGPGKAGGAVFSIRVPDNHSEVRWTPSVGQESG